MESTQMSVSKKTTATLLADVPPLPPAEAKHLDRLNCEAACDMEPRCAAFVWKPAETFKCLMVNSTEAMYVSTEHADDLLKKPAVYAKACGKGCGEVLNVCENSETTIPLGDAVYESCTKTPTKTTRAYKINPLKEPGVYYNVICDFGLDKTAAGADLSLYPWTIFQRRVVGGVDFYRDYDDYKKGFGNTTGDFWSGLETIRALTKAGTAKLRVGLCNGASCGSSTDPSDKSDFSKSYIGVNTYALYSSFSVGPDSDRYRLSVSGFSNQNGNQPGDSLAHQNSQQFSAVGSDVSNAGTCVNSYRGGWWYNSCHHSNLNGIYGDNTYGKGLNWYTGFGHKDSVERVEMAISDGPWVGTGGSSSTTTVQPSGAEGSVPPTSSGGSYDGPITTSCPDGTSTIDIDFNSGVDDFGNNKGSLRFTGKQGFVVYFTDDDSTGKQADGVEITNQQAGNCHAAGNCNANQASKSGGFVMGSNNDPGVGNYDIHTSGVVAVFNQGATKVSFMDTDDDGTLKAVFAFDKDGNFIGQSTFASQKDVSIDISQTTDNRLIYSLEFDTKKGTAGGSNDGTVFTIDNFHAEGLCANTQIGGNPKSPCRSDCAANQFVSGCTGSSQGTCAPCDPKNCPDGFFLTGCGGFGAGTCISDPAQATSDPSAAAAAANTCKNREPGVIGTHKNLKNVLAPSDTNTCRANVSTPFKITNGVTLGLEKSLDKQTCGVDYRLRVAAVGRVKLSNQRIIENAQDCDDHWTDDAVSGIFPINPGGIGAFNVWCDFDRADGPWTVFQKRFDGSVNFYVNYANYENGIGAPGGEYWLGLKYIHRLTELGDIQLRTDLCIGAQCTTLRHSDFSVSNAADGYRLSVSGPDVAGGTTKSGGLGTLGTGGKGLVYHSGNRFSAKDRDQDSHSSNCAVQYTGGWWYNGCHYVNLNGDYSQNGGVNGMSWKNVDGTRPKYTTSQISLSRKSVAQKIPTGGCPTSHPIKIGNWCESRRLHCNMAVKITASNDRPIVSSGQSRTTAEESPVGTTVGLPLVVQDADVDAGKQSVSWKVNACSPFEISKCPLRVNGCTGSITVIDSKSLDYETVPQIILTVVASDDGSPSLSSPETNVTVILTNANDPPTISAQSFTVVENRLIGWAVGKVIANDPDQVDNTLSYIDETTLPTPFIINGSGWIVVRSQVNFEGSASDVSLKVKVTDNGGLSSNSVLINIKTTDANDPPVVLGFEDNNDVLTISEKCTPGADASIDSTCVRTFSAEDDDNQHPSTNAGNPLIWSFATTPSTATSEETSNLCDHASLFTLSSGGVFSTKVSGTPLNYEAMQYCYLWLKVVDKAGLSSSPRRVKIDVINSNEPPVLSTSPSTCNVPENTPAGTKINTCNISVTDPDVLDMPRQVVTVFQTQSSSGLKYDSFLNKLVVFGNGLDYETS
jgi:ficolin